MKRKRLRILLLLALTFGCAQAQDDGFTADRPGATTGSDVLPKGRVQWETGMGWERSKMENPSTTTWTLNNSLLRWGFSRYAELRLQADALYTTNADTHYGGIANAALGTKVRLFEGRKALPAVSLLGNLLIPGCKNAHYLPRHLGG